MPDTDMYEVLLCFAYAAWRTYAMHAGRHLPHHQGLCLESGMQHIWRMAGSLAVEKGCHLPLDCQKPCVADQGLWGFG